MRIIKSVYNILGMCIPLLLPTLSIGETSPNDSLKTANEISALKDTAITPDSISTTADTVSLTDSISSIKDTGSVNDSITASTDTVINADSIDTIKDSAKLVNAATVIIDTLRSDSTVADITPVKTALTQVDHAAVKKSATPKRKRIFSRTPELRKKSIIALACSGGVLAVAITTVLLICNNDDENPGKTGNSAVDHPPSDPF